MISVNDKILAIRHQMHAKQLDAYLIPSSDPHQSEYVATHWKSREWASGFSGSAGILIITSDHAGLWTDSRYFIQAEQELSGSNVVLHQQKVPHAPEHIQWLTESLPEGAKVGCDGWLFSVNQVRQLQKAFYKKNIELDPQHDLIASIWEDRPALPNGKAVEHPIHFAGKSRSEKLSAIRNEMKKQKANYYLLTTLDDIAWLFNLRGSDVAFNPVLISYALIGEEVAHLFIQKEKVPTDLQETLRSEGVLIKEYTAIEATLKSLSAEDRLLVNKASLNIQLFQAIHPKTLIESSNLAVKLKAIKNETEIKHIRRAMEKDGVALTRMYRWLENTLQERTVSEVELGEKLASFRATQEDYASESFPAIVGYKGNGAIVHYNAQPGSCAEIEADGMLLVDSGGQYTDGTTDITRTITLGTPSAEEKANFTRVLKGMIALSRSVFPTGTTGIQLDSLARQYLWEAHLNFGHGTGHGVGFFNNVHEAPQGFSPVAGGRSLVPLEAGMLTSNEPGYYKEGAYGIRIENLVLTIPSGKTSSGDFLCFETMTLFPIDQHLIDVNLMAPAEIDWLNDYHQQVEQRLSPYLNDEEKIWMKEKCKPLLVTT